MSDWGRLDNQPAMTGLEMKSFLTNYSNNLARGLEVDMVGGSVVLKDKQAFCMSCKKKQKIANPTVKDCPNKKTVMLKGNCAKCKTKVSTFMSKNA